MITGLRVVSTTDMASILGVKSASTVIRRANREGWKQNAKCRHGAIYWLISSMPRATRELVLAGLVRQASMQPQKAAEDSGQVGICPQNASDLRQKAQKQQQKCTFSQPAKISARDREVAISRLGLIREIERMSEIVGRERAIRRLVSGAAANDLPESTVALVSSALACRRGGLTRRTIYRWLAAFETSGLDGLLPRQGRKAPVPDWLPQFLRHYQKPQQPGVPMAYALFRNDLQKSGAQSIPSIHAVRRVLAKMSAPAKAAGRLTGNSLLKLRPHQRRDTSELWPGDVYTADGTTFDAEILHPSHGQPFKPEITAILDVATRRCVGISINLSESALAILDALRAACVFAGIPALFYTDNGPGYINRLLLDDRSGMLARLGVTPVNSIPGRPQGKGLMERAVKTLWTRAAQGLASYTGALMDADAARVNFKKSRAAIKAGRRPDMPLYDDFRRYLARCVDDYNNTPHRGLPRYRDSAGRLAHYTPNEFWQLYVERGFAPVEVPAGLEVELFRPGELRVVRNGWLTVFGGRYFSEELEEYHGQRIEARYDSMDAGKVWCWTGDGRYICEASLEGNTMPYFPQSRVEAAREKRARAQVRRIEAKLERVAPGSSVSLPQDEAVAASVIENEPRAVGSETGQDERPRLFASRYEKYCWLMTHQAAQLPEDAEFFAQYRKSEEYAEMKDLLEIKGIA